MLFQITNMCHEGCEHCLHCSHPNGEHMTMDTLVQALNFARFMQSPIIVVSGGEPTLHPNFYEMCKVVSKYSPFIVCSNGTFVENDEQREAVEKVMKLPNLFEIQVYSHPDFYKSYEKVLSYKDYFDKHTKISFDDSPIANMDDLGRARTSAKAQEYINNHTYTMSCANMSLIAKQSSIARNVPKLYHSLSARVMCKPLVDYKGNVHMSESNKCPSVGNVNEDMFLNIADNMIKFKPCMSCKNSQRIFLEKNKLYRTILGV